MLENVSDTEIRLQKENDELRRQLDDIEHWADVNIDNPRVYEALSYIDACYFVKSVIGV